MAAFEARSPAIRRIGDAAASLSKRATTMLQTRSALHRGLIRGNSGHAARIDHRESERRRRGRASRVEFIRQIESRDQARPVPLAVTRKP
jgi:hypothetical protein